MPYAAEISRINPMCFLFMIDQSTSMKHEISAGNITQQKCTGVADTVNRWLQELSLKCAKAEGVGDYYHVGVIGYGSKVGSAFMGKIAGQDLVPISEIAENPGRVEDRMRKVPDGSGGMTEQVLKVPIWFDPVANGGTPMCKAASEAHRVLKGWLKGHRDCYPPVVINITDGEATDGNAEKRIGALTGLSSSDGDTMLFNIHLSAHPNATPIIFPDSPDQLPDVYSRMLFNASSLLTPGMRTIATEQGIPTTEGSRAFVLNADMVLLVQAIDIGTRPSNVEAALSEFAAEPVQSSEPAGYVESVPGSEAAREESLIREAEEFLSKETVGAAVANAGNGKKTIRLTDQSTGKIIEATIDTDEQGNIINVVPVEPLDPDKDYGVGPSSR